MGQGQPAMQWDPHQYLAFANHRMRPALELIARIPLRSPSRIVDLGCGAGNITPHLRARWPEAALIGVDNSPEMLAQAAKVAVPGLPAQWETADLATWAPSEPVDLIFSNAALHWIGAHFDQFPRLVRALAPGGVFAVQMPRNFLAPSHQLMTVAAQAGPWRGRLAPLMNLNPVFEPSLYYDWLAPLCKTVDIWETEYQQVLTGENPVAEFTKGSWLKSFLDLLQEPERSQFETEYRKLILTAYRPHEDGKTLFPFKRMFIVAQV